MKPLSKIKICLIDDGVASPTFSELLSPMPTPALTDLTPSFVPPQATAVPNHGTVCLALLCEFLNRFHLLSRVELFTASIADAKGVQTVALLEDALCLCFVQGADLVCLSAGFYRYCSARRILALLRRHPHCLVIAAQSNESQITYPASLPHVLGVRYDPQLPPGQFSFIPHAADGIEIAAALPASRVLSQLGYTSFTANSFIPPYLAAQLVHLAQRDGLFRRPQAIRRFFRENLAAGVSGSSVCKAPCPCDLPPIVLFPYRKAARESVWSFAAKLQRLFLHGDYDCALLGEHLSHNQIARHQFQLPGLPSREFFERLSVMAEPGILLVCCRYKTADRLLKNGLADAFILPRQIFQIYEFPAHRFHKVSLSPREPYHLYQWLLRHFSSEEKETL